MEQLQRKSIVFWNCFRTRSSNQRTSSLSVLCDKLASLLYF